MNHELKLVAGFDPLHGGLVCQECLSGLGHPIIACSPTGQACLQSLLRQPMTEAASGWAGFREAVRVLEQALITQTEAPLKSRAFLDFAPTVSSVVIARPKAAAIS